MKSFTCKKILLALLSSLVFGTSAFAVSNDAFIIMVRTNTPDGNFTIPTTGSDYNYSVNCNAKDGDDDETTNETGDYTCFYSPTGLHKISISGDFPRFYLNNNSDKDKIISVEQWGTQQWTSMENTFRGASNLHIRATDTPDLSLVTDFSSMFSGASSMNEDISNWDVSHATEMSYMFSGASSFNQDIGNWDVSAVNGGMHAMFEGATLFNQDIGDWDVSNVVTMQFMFTDANLSLSNYDNMLNSWAQLTVTSSEFFADDTHYCEGNDSREKLHDDFGWYFQDAGYDCSFYIDSNVTVSVEDAQSAVMQVTTVTLGTPTYSNIGGADGALFSIESASGMLSFIDPPEYSNPLDKNGDNIYRVQVLSTDGTSTDTQTIRVEVTSDGAAIVPIISYLLF